MSKYCGICNNELIKKEKESNRDFNRRRFCCRSCSSSYSGKIKHKNTTKEIRWKEDNNGCWICTSHAKNAFGYPICMRFGKYMSISRYMYKTYIGEFDESLEILHSCDNPNCINPCHLRPGTHAENMKDVAIRFRSGQLGEKCHFSKLKEDDVKRIFYDASMSNRKLAKKYNIGRDSIDKIKTRKIWKHITLKLI